MPTPGPSVSRVLLLLISTGKQFGTLQSRDVTLKVAQYAEPLRDVPTWAVEKARLIFGKGGWRCVWDGLEVPTSAMVVAECRHILLPLEAELAKIESVLNAKVYEGGADASERAKAVAHWADVKAEMAAGSPVQQRTDEEIAAERSEQERANERFRERGRRAAAAEGRRETMWGTIPISDELAAYLRRSFPRSEPARRAG